MASWREKLAITQQALADYFKISRSLLSLVEIGMRELPTQALLAFNQLVSNYEAADSTQLKAAYAQQKRPFILEMLEKRVKDNAWKVERCRKQLAVMEKTYQQALNQVQALRDTQHQLATDPHASEKDRRTLWLRIQEDESIKALERNGLLAQIELRLTIEELQASIEVSQRMAKEV